MLPRSTSPTPAGVPVRMTSPGSSVKAADAYSMIEAMPWIMSAVVPMIEAKCGEMNKRDRNTLQRRIEKAVRSFVAGGSAK